MLHTLAVVPLSSTILEEAKSKMTRKRIESFISNVMNNRLTY